MDLPTPTDDPAPQVASRPGTPAAPVSSRPDPRALEPPPGEPFPDGPAPDGSPPEGSPPDRSPPGRSSQGEGAPSDPRRSPTVAWPVWTAGAALIGGLILAAVGSLIVDIPALSLGVRINSSHLPPGIEIADTTVQDVSFVLAAAFFAQLGGRGVRAWQFGLRHPGVGWWKAARL